MVEAGATGAIGPRGGVGPEGSRGPMGTTGVSGSQGSSGPEGVRGVMGLTGPPGTEGPRGFPGRKGERGPKGDKGDEGTVDEELLKRLIAQKVGRSGEVVIGWGARLHGPLGHTSAVDDLYVRVDGTNPLTAPWNAADVITATGFTLGNNENLTLGTATFSFDGTDVIVAPVGDLLINEDNKALALGAASGGDVRLYWDSSSFNISRRTIIGGDATLSGVNASLFLTGNNSLIDFTGATATGLLRVLGSTHIILSGGSGAQAQVGPEQTTIIMGDLTLTGDSTGGDDAAVIRDYSGNIHMTISEGGVGTPFTTFSQLTQILTDSVTTIQNTTDADSNLVLDLRGGDRGTPTNDDEGILFFSLDADTGFQNAFAQLKWIATDVDNSNKEGALEFYVRKANSLTKILTIDGTGVTAVEGLHLLATGDDQFVLEDSATGTDFSLNIINATADYFSIAEVGVAHRLAITVGGNVGIGTVVPLAKLDVRGSAIFNQAGDDADFRIGGDTDQELLFVNAGTDHVGVSTTTPLSTFEVAGSFGTNITAISSNTTLNDTHHVVTCDASGGAFTVTLPAASGIMRRIYHIKKTDSSGNAVTVDGNSSETIDDALTQVINVQYDSMMIACDGSNWHII